MGDFNYDNDIERLFDEKDTEIAALKIDLCNWSDRCKALDMEVTCFKERVRELEAELSKAISFRHPLAGAALKAENQRLKEALNIVHDDILRNKSTISASAWKVILAALGKEDAGEPVPY